MPVARPSPRQPGAIRPQLRSVRLCGDAVGKLRAIEFASIWTLSSTEEARRVRAKTFELVEFLHDIVKADALPWAAFPHKVALHNNCQTLRGLRIASMSELREEPFSKPMNLLGKVKGTEFVHLARQD